MHDSCHTKPHNKDQELSIPALCMNLNGWVQQGWGSYVIGVSSWSEGMAFILSALCKNPELYNSRLDD